MNWAQAVAFLEGFAPIVEPILVNIEQNQIQPELKKLIDQVQNPELKTFLTGLDQALDALVKAEIGKI